MNKCVIAALSTAVMFISIHSFARSGWQQPTRITQLIIEGSPAGERIYVQFEADFNPDACTGKDTQWKRIYGDTDKGKYLLTTALSVKLTGQKVVPLLYGCDDWGRPMLTGLWIQ
jgi:hypothetical protein